LIHYAPCFSVSLLTSDFLVPETCRAALEDIDVLFETNPTWLIGPGSRKKIAQIIANHEAGDAGEKPHAEAEAKGSSELKENLPERKISTE
jgi:hypothetical protein